MTTFNPTNNINGNGSEQKSLITNEETILEMRDDEDQTIEPNRERAYS